MKGIPVRGDAFYYHYGAQLLADGKGFPDPIVSLGKLRLVPGAQHPPLYIVALAVPSVLGFTSFLDHQLFSCVVGAASVVLIGLTGRRLAGPVVGAAAAGIAALYPGLWVHDGLVMSETLAIFLTTAVALAAYRVIERPTAVRAAALGCLVGLAALTRAELLLLAVFVVLPVATRRARRGSARVGYRHRAATLGVALLGCVVVMAPWLGYNLTRFHHPELVTSSLGNTLYVGNSPVTWSGPHKGWWDFSLMLAPPPPGDASDQDLAYRRLALRFVADHASQLPDVLLAREGRVWSLHRPSQQATLDAQETPNLAGVLQAGQVFFYPLAVSAIAGGILLSRRRTPLAPILAPILTTTIITAVFYGELRYRAPAEPMIVLLAAVALVALAQAVRSGTAAPAAARHPADITIRSQTGHALEGSRVDVASPDEERPASPVRLGRADAICEHLPHPGRPSRVVPSDVVVGEPAIPTSKSAVEPER